MGNYNTTMATARITGNGRVLLPTKSTGDAIYYWPNEERREFSGEMSIDNVKGKHLLLNEPNKVKFKTTFPVPEANISPTDVLDYHGTGHIIARNKLTQQCTSIPICMDALTINGSQVITAKYIGYMERDFDFSKAELHVCVTFAFGVQAV